VAVEKPAHAVAMLDPPDVIRRKIARAQTDAEPEVKAPAGPGVANLLDIYAALRNIDATAALAEFAGKPYSALKQAVAEALIAELEPVQRRFAELRGDEKALRGVLEASADRVRVIADATLLRVQRAVGIR
jgi:tryptophanyl-tRNA synthetase